MGKLFSKSQTTDSLFTPLSFGKGVQFDGFYCKQEDGGNAANVRGIAQVETELLVRSDRKSFNIRCNDSVSPASRAS
jgi:hypothetical protein